MDYKDFKSTEKQGALSFWHQARLNLIFYLLKSTLTKNTMQILDIGCGTGTELSVLKKFGYVTALDNNSKALVIAKKNDCETILADIEKHNLNSNYYDAVCCFDILEHLETDQTVINNIYNSLKTGGYFFFTVPAVKSLFSGHDIVLGHKRRYSKKEISQKLETAGFKIIKVNYWNSLLFPAIYIYRMIKKILMKINKKKVYKSDLKIYNKFINKLLFLILDFDNKLISYNINLWFGLTIYGIAKKI